MFLGQRVSPDASLSVPSFPTRNTRTRVRFCPLLTTSRQQPTSTRVTSGHQVTSAPARQSTSSHAVASPQRLSFGKTQLHAPTHQKVEQTPFLSTVLHRVKGLLTSPHDQLIFNLAAPAILALAADPLLAMVDTAIVGQLGQHELAALGVNNSLFGFAFVVFNFLSTATCPMVAAALSAKDTKKSGETISQALILASVLGTVVTIGLTMNAGAALQLMGLDNSDPQLMQLATDFLLIRATAAPAALLVSVSQGVFRGLQDMRTPLAVTLVTNLIHLGLSLAFIFPGHMGLAGAALSTSVAEWLAAVAYLALGWQRRQELGMWPLPDLDPRKAWKQYMPFLQAGGAVLMRTAVLLGTKTLASAVATRLGPASIASHQVLSQVWILSSLIIDSLAISGQTMVAVSLGQGDRTMARHITDRLLQLGLGLGLGLSAIMALAGPVWPHMFTQDEQVLSQVFPLLPLAVWMLPLNALVYVLDGVLVGASDFQFLVWAMVLASGSAAGLLLAVEPLHLGLTGVWGAQAVLMAGRLVTLGYRFMSPDGPLPPSSNTLGSWSTDEDDPAAQSYVGVDTYASTAATVDEADWAYPAARGAEGVSSQGSWEQGSASGSSRSDTGTLSSSSSSSLWSADDCLPSASLSATSLEQKRQMPDSGSWRPSAYGSSSGGVVVRGGDDETMPTLMQGFGMEIEVFGAGPGCSPLHPAAPELLGSVQIVPLASMAASTLPAGIHGSGLVSGAARLGSGLGSNCSNSGSS